MKRSDRQKNVETQFHMILFKLVDNKKGPA